MKKFFIAVAIMLAVCMAFTFTACDMSAISSLLSELETNNELLSELNNKTSSDETEDDNDGSTDDNQTDDGSETDDGEDGESDNGLTDGSEDDGTEADSGETDGGSTDNGGETSDTSDGETSTTVDVAVDASELKALNLGRGINALTGTYLDLSDGDTLKTGEFVDYNKLAAMGTTSITTQSGELITVTGSSIEEYMANITSKYTNTSSASLGVSLGSAFGFTAGFSSKFSLSSSFSVTEETVQYFYTSYQYYNASRCYITDVSAATLKKNGVVSASVLSQLDDMSELSGSALDAAIMTMFNSYGTHIITDAVYGGKIEIYYSQITNSSDITSETTAGYENTLKAALKASSSSASASAEAESSSGYDTELGINQKNGTTYTNFNIRSYGGSAFSSSSFSDLGGAYRDWIEDFNNQTAKETMIDVSSGGLVAIWDLLPDEYNDIAVRMAELFSDELEEDNNEFLNRFAVNSTVEDGVSKGFAGGKGTEASPYLISTPAQFALISTYDSESTYFKLSNDISFYGLVMTPFETFSGHLDGDGHAISNWSYTSNSNSTSAKVGLFRTLKGTVSNLIVSGFSVTANSTDSGIVYAGALAGVNSGTINNCIVKSSTVAISHNYTVGTYDYVKSFGGGMVGENSGSITNSAVYNNKVSVQTHTVNHSDGKFWAKAGGMAGHNTGSVSACYAMGNSVSSSACGGKTWTFTKALVVSVSGGLVGFNEGTVQYSFAEGNTLSAEALVKAGAINGYTYKGQVVAQNSATVSYCCYLSGETCVGKEESGSSLKDNNAVTSNYDLLNYLSFVNRGWHLESGTVVPTNF